MPTQKNPAASDPSCVQHVQSFSLLSFMVHAGCALF